MGLLVRHLDHFLVRAFLWGFDVAGLVLCNVLRHNLIVKLKWISTCKVVIQLAALGLDDVRFAWGRCVMQPVLLGVAIFEELLVLPSRILLLDQSSSWTLMFF